MQVKQKIIKVCILFLMGFASFSFAAAPLSGGHPSDSSAVNPKPILVTPYDVTISLAPSSNSSETPDQHNCRGERLSAYQEHYVMSGNMYYFPSSSVGGSGITIPYDGTYQITAVVYLCKNQYPDFNKEVDLFKNLKIKNDPAGNVQYFYPEAVLQATVISLNGPASWTYHNSPIIVRGKFNKGDVIWLGIGPTQEGTGDAVFTGGTIQITRIRQ